MRLRAATSAAIAVAAGLLVVPAEGAMRRQVNQIVDPKGDARGDVNGTLAFLDVVTGRWRVEGTGARRALVASLTLAATPNADRGFHYELQAEVEGCGTVVFEYSPGTVSATRLGAKSLYLGCGAPGEPLGSMSLYDEVSVDVDGTTLTWSVPLSALPEEIRPGALFSDFWAVTDVADPVFGESAGSAPKQTVDSGHGDGSWRLR